MLLQGFVNLLLFLSASSWHSVLRMFKKLSAVISLNFLSSNKRSALWGHLMRLTLSTKLMSSGTAFTLLRMPTYGLTSFGDEDNLWSYLPAIVPFSRCGLERSFSRKRDDVIFSGSFSRSFPFLGVFWPPTVRTSSSSVLSLIFQTGVTYAPCGSRHFHVFIRHFHSPFILSLAASQPDSPYHSALYRDEYSGTS